jgi:hypothetical protein
MVASAIAAGCWFSLKFEGAALLGARAVLLNQYLLWVCEIQIHEKPGNNLSGEP